MADKATALFWAKEIKKLCGATIKNPIIDADTDPENVWWGFRCVKKDGTSFNVWVQGDEEGNYPGALSIEKAPRKAAGAYKDIDDEAHGLPPLSEVTITKVDNLLLTPEQVKARNKILDAHQWMGKEAKK